MAPCSRALFRSISSCPVVGVADWTEGATAGVGAGAAAGSGAGAAAGSGAGAVFSFFFPPLRQPHALTLSTIVSKATKIIICCFFITKNLPFPSCVLTAAA
ncbi:MAG: hypothetical protein C0610_13435 [Desulfobacteraceae bacterium]|nr:MAG: hypothetical protein C0610_13435 [Desulfobacteraceae bacterium]